MKITKILSASVLAGAVLFGSTACGDSGTGGNVPDLTPSASSEASSSPAVEETETSEDSIETEYVLDTLNGYYGFIAQTDTFDKVRAAGSDLTGRAVTDEELQDFTSTFYEGFQYFDTSTSQDIKNAYNAMMLGSNAGYEREGIQITAPAEGVTVDGDTATFNTSYIVLTENGKTYPSEPESNPDPADVINLVKNDEGNWVIVAKDSATKVTAP